MPKSPEFEAAYAAKQTLRDQLLGPHRTGGIALRTRSVDGAIAAAVEGRNVHAVGLGRKIVGGRMTDDLSLRIYVTQKLPASLLGDQALPAEFEGLPTDIIESAPAFLLPTVTDTEEIAVPGLAVEDAVLASQIPLSLQQCSIDRHQRQRPVQGGISTGHPVVTAGTIACFCRSTREGDDPEQIFVLSNNHVYADVNNASVGDPLLQQGTIDGGGLSDEIARLERFVQLRLSDTASNRVDGAIGKMLPRIDVDPGICSIGRLSGTATGLELMRVRKHGRTTSLTHGVITDESYDPVVGMDHQNPHIVARFQDQLRIDGVLPTPVFGLGGDSGSLVVTERGTSAVGLYFAGPESGLYGIANPIATVLDELEIELI